MSRAVVAALRRRREVAQLRAKACMVLPLQTTAGMHEPANAVALAPATSLPRPLTIRSLFAATLAVTMYVAAIAPQRPHRFFVQLNTSKLEIAKLTTLKYAVEAAPQWAAKHPVHACPRTLYDLDPYMTSWHQPDPWGHEYVMTCNNGSVYVASLGEDGRANTADDIWSHR